MINHVTGKGTKETLHKAFSHNTNSFYSVNAQVKGDVLTSGCSYNFTMQGEEFRAV